MKWLLVGLSLVSLHLMAKTAQSPQKRTRTDDPVQSPKKRMVADKALAIIYHAEGTIIICQSDLKADLSERIPTLRDAIIKELLILDGKKLKIPVLESEVDRALARAQEQMNMTRDELITFFKEQGYSLEEAKKELERSIMVENVIEARIKSKAHVPQKTIEQYHKDNPIDLYGLQQAFVSFNGGSKALTRAMVKREIASGEINTSADWIDVGEVQGKDFAPEKAHIKELPVGSVIIGGESNEGIALLKLISKKTVTLDERKNDIANMLAQEKYMHAQKGYFDKLLSDATIKYIDQSSPAA